jgi:hypothetical protein
VREPRAQHWGEEQTGVSSRDSTPASDEEHASDVAGSVSAVDDLGRHREFAVSPGLHVRSHSPLVEHLGDVGEVVRRGDPRQ